MSNPDLKLKSFLSIFPSRLKHPQPLAFEIIPNKDEHFLAEDF